jgi:hypothetical protein
MRAIMIDPGLQVWVTIADLFHKGETKLDPDSDEGIELRKAALSALSV